MTQKPFTVMDLAQRWGCTRQSVYAIIKEGKLRTFRVGGKLIRILPDEVLRWESGGGSMPLENTGSDTSKGKPLSSGKTHKVRTAEDWASSMK